MIVPSAVAGLVTVGLIAALAVMDQHGTAVSSAPEATALLWLAPIGSAGSAPLDGAGPSATRDPPSASW